MRPPHPERSGRLSGWSGCPPRTTYRGGRLSSAPASPRGNPAALALQWGEFSVKGTAQPCSRKQARRHCVSVTMLHCAARRSSSRGPVAEVRREGRGGGSLSRRAPHATHFRPHDTK